MDHLQPTLSRLTRSPAAWLCVGLSVAAGVYLTGRTDAQIQAGETTAAARKAADENESATPGSVDQALYQSDASASEASQINRVGFWPSPFKNKAQATTSTAAKPTTKTGPWSRFKKQPAPTQDPFGDSERTGDDVEDDGSDLTISTRPTADELAPARGASRATRRGTPASRRRLMNYQSSLEQSTAADEPEQAADKTSVPGRRKVVQPQRRLLGKVDTAAADDISAEELQSLFADENTVKKSDSSNQSTARVTETVTADSKVDDVSDVSMDDFEEPAVAESSTAKIADTQADSTEAAIQQVSQGTEAGEKQPEATPEATTSADSDEDLFDLPETPATPSAPEVHDAVPEAEKPTTTPRTTTARTSARQAIAPLTTREFEPAAEEPAAPTVPDTAKVPEAEPTSARSIRTEATHSKTTQPETARTERSRTETTRTKTSRAEINEREVPRRVKPLKPASTPTGRARVDTPDMSTQSRVTRVVDPAEPPQSVALPRTRPGHAAAPVLRKNKSTPVVVHPTTPEDSDESFSEEEVELPIIRPAPRIVPPQLSKPPQPPADEVKEEDYFETPELARREKQREVSRAHHLAKRPESAPTSISKARVPQAAVRASQQARANRPMQVDAPDGWSATKFRTRQYGSPTPTERPTYRTPPSIVEVPADDDEDVEARGDVASEELDEPQFPAPQERDPDEVQPISEAALTRPNAKLHNSLQVIPANSDSPTKLNTAVFAGETPTVETAPVKAQPEVQEPTIIPELARDNQSHWLTWVVITFVAGFAACRLLFRPANAD